MPEIFRGRGGYRGRGGFRGRGRGGRGGGRGRGGQANRHKPKTFSDEKTRLCSVCDKADRKYRCPQCSIQYCSLACYKVHKTKCLSDDLDIENDPEDVRAAALSAASSAGAHPALTELVAHEKRMAIKRGEAREDGEIELFSSDTGSSDDDDDNVYDDGNPDRLNEKRLKNLSSCTKLKELLANPHLRNLVLEVDGAEDKNATMHAAMQEPLFIELADACLEAIEHESIG